MAGNMIFAQRIKSLRSAHNESQATLAKEFNYRKQSISHWENNGKVPRPDVLRLLANRYNVSTDYLLGNDVETRDVAGAEKSFLVSDRAIKLSAQEKMLLAIFGRMDRKQKETLLKMLDAFMPTADCSVKPTSLRVDNKGKMVAEECEQYRVE